jgi:hypothetical protein
MVTNSCHCKADGAPGKDAFDPGEFRVIAVVTRKEGEAG